MELIEALKQHQSGQEIWRPSWCKEKTIKVEHTKSGVCLTAVNASGKPVPLFAHGEENADDWRLTMPLL